MNVRYKYERVVPFLMFELLPKLEIVDAPMKVTTVKNMVRPCIDCHALIFRLNKDIETVISCWSRNCRDRVDHC